MSTERKAVFVSTQQSKGPPGYPERSGQIVAVVRPLTQEEADLHEVGPMYKVKFADGLETNIFADELTFFLDKPATTNNAKPLVKAMLDGLQLPYTKLTAKTVGFMDLARASCVFVKVHGWKPDPRIEEIEKMAKANGFRVQTDHCFG